MIVRPRSVSQNAFLFFFRSGRIKKEKGKKREGEKEKEEGGEEAGNSTTDLNKQAFQREKVQLSQRQGCGKIWLRIATGNKKVNGRKR